MVSNILIAVGFFGLGFLIGGAFILRTAWKTIDKLKKQVRDAQKKNTIIIHERI